MKDKIVDANMERNKGSFSETVFEAAKLIHQANEGDSFLSALVKEGIEDGELADVQVRISGGLTPRAARWFFIPLFANPEMQKQAQLILSIIGIVGHENAADYLAKLELATECDNDESD